MAFPTDLDIASKAQIKLLAEIAEHAHIADERLEFYGRDVVKASGSEAGLAAIIKIAEEHGIRSARSAHFADSGAAGLS